MSQSIILATWIKPDFVEVSRQVIIPNDIDPTDISEGDLRQLASAQGFNIAGDLSWEVLIDNSRFWYMTTEQKRAIKLAEKIDRLIADLQDATAELYEIAHNR